MKSSKNLDVYVAQANEFNLTGGQGAKSKHQVVEVANLATGKHYYDKPEKHLWIAQAEVIAQELNRATYPNNPVTMYKKDQDGIHVLSQRVEGFISLHDLIDQQGGRGIVAHKILTGEYKNFGTCIVLALTSNEADLHNGNIGIDKDGNFVKIDADWNNGRIRYEHYDDNSHKFNITSSVISELPKLDTNDFMPYNWFDQVSNGELVAADKSKFAGLLSDEKTNKLVKNEINAQILRKLLLPPECIRAIVGANTVSPNDAKAQLNEHLKSRLQLMKSACMNKSFRKYVNSNEGKAVMQDYAKQLGTHQLTNGKTLGSPDAIEQMVNQQFGMVSTLANTSSSKQKEQWYANYNQCINSATNNSSTDRAEQLYLAIVSHDKRTTQALLQGDNKDLLKQTNDKQQTPLLYAAKHGFDDGFKMFRRAKADMFATDYKGDNCLGLAAKSGSIQIVDAALKAGIDINSVNNDGKSALMQAAEFGNTHVVNYLMKNGATLTNRDSGNNSALVYAAAYGNIDCVKELLSTGRPDVYNDDKQIIKALMFAVHKGEFNTANEILTLTASKQAIYLTDKKCIPYLSILAAEDGNSVLLAHLLKLQGDTPHIKLENGSNVLSIILRDNHMDCLDVLLKSGRLDQQDISVALSDALAKYRENNNSDIVRVLLNNNADVNFAINDQNHNYTPLMLAIKSGDAKIIDHILANSNDTTINHAAADGATALTKAFEYGNYDVALKLLKHPSFDIGQNPAMVDFALAEACKNGQILLAAELLAKNADINFADPGNNNETPLMLAIRSGNDQLIEMILNHDKFNSIKHRNAKGSDAATIALLEVHNPELAVRLSKVSKTNDQAPKSAAPTNTTKNIAMTLAGGDKNSAKDTLQKKQEPKKTQAPSASSPSYASNSSDSANVTIMDSDPGNDNKGTASFGKRK